jgi:thiamine biosynthesis lipoprotein
MKRLELRSEGPTVVKNAPGLRIDLSAIAKGYGVDRVAAALEAEGISDYMIEVGGEIRAAGHKLGDKPWVLGIEHPSFEMNRAVHGAITATEPLALATSGDYRTFLEVDGQKYSHTIDPRTGRPTPLRTASVSVVRPTAAEADALATGLGVLEPAAAIRLADENNWPVYLILREKEGFRAQASQAFSALKFEVRLPLGSQ